MSASHRRSCGDFLLGAGNCFPSVTLELRTKYSRSLDQTLSARPHVAADGHWPPFSGEGRTPPPLRATRFCRASPSSKWWSRSCWVIAVGLVLLDSDSAARRPRSDPLGKLLPPRYTHGGGEVVLALGEAHWLSALSIAACGASHLRAARASRGCRRVAVEVALFRDVKLLFGVSGLRFSVRRCALSSASWRSISTICIRH